MEKTYLICTLSEGIIMVSFFSITVMDKWANKQMQTHHFIQGQCHHHAIQEIRDLWRLHNFKMTTLSSSHYHTKPSNLNQMKIYWYKKTKDHHLNYLAVAVSMKNLLGALGDSIFLFVLLSFSPLFLSIH